MIILHSASSILELGCMFVTISIDFVLAYCICYSSAYFWPYVVYVAGHFYYKQRKVNANHLQQ